MYDWGCTSKQSTVDYCRYPGCNIQYVTYYKLIFRRLEKSENPSCLLAIS